MKINKNFFLLQIILIKEYTKITGKVILPRL